MGKRGPLPKPDALKKLLSNPGKRPLRSNIDISDSPPPVPPRCPNWLPREAKAIWRRIVPELFKLGVIRESDGDCLTLYCATYAHWVAAEKYIQQHGETYEVTTRSGPRERTRPQVAMAKRYLGVLDKLSRSLGLTPAARARIQPRPAEPPDSLESILKH